MLSRAHQKQLTCIVRHLFLWGWPCGVLFVSCFLLFGGDLVVAEAEEHFLERRLVNHVALTLGRCCPLSRCGKCGFSVDCNEQDASRDHRYIHPDSAINPSPTHILPRSLVC